MILTIKIKIQVVKKEKIFFIFFLKFCVLVYVSVSVLFYPKNKKDKQTCHESIFFVITGNMCFFSLLLFRFFLLKFQSSFGSLCVSLESFNSKSVIKWKWQEYKRPTWCNKFIHSSISHTKVSDRENFQFRQKKMFKKILTTSFLFALIAAASASPSDDYEDEMVRRAFMKRGMRKNNEYNWGASMRGPGNAFW